MALFSTGWSPSHCFSVRCENNLSSLSTSSGSVLGRPLFIMYTTSLSTLISSLSPNHHLCADDTQLFFSFLRPNDSSIIRFQNAVQQISSWMTANLNTLSSSKTEFLVTGLKATCQSTQLLTRHHSLCSQPPPYLWWARQLCMTSSLLNLLAALLCHSSLI